METQSTPKYLVLQGPDEAVAMGLVWALLQTVTKRETQHVKLISKFASGKDAVWYGAKEPLSTNINDAGAVLLLLAEEYQQYLDLYVVGGSMRAADEWVAIVRGQGYKLESSRTRELLNNILCIRDFIGGDKDTRHWTPTMIDYFIFPMCSWLAELPMDQRSHWRPMMIWFVRVYDSAFLDFGSSKWLKDAWSAITIKSMLSSVATVRTFIAGIAPTPVPPNSQHFVVTFGHVEPNQTKVLPKDAFGKMKIRIGRIIEVWVHPAATKLYCARIDVGEGKPRSIVTGLVGKKTLDQLNMLLALVLVNVVPRKIRGELSEAMILCATSEESGKIEILQPCRQAHAQPGDFVCCHGEDGSKAKRDIVPSGDFEPWCSIKKVFRTDSEGKAAFLGEALMVKDYPCPTSPCIMNGQIS